MRNTPPSSPQKKTETLESLKQKVVRNLYTRLNNNKADTAKVEEEIKILNNKDFKNCKSNLKTDLLNNAIKTANLDAKDWEELKEFVQLIHNVCIKVVEANNKPKPGFDFKSVFDAINTKVAPLLEQPKKLSVEEEATRAAEVENLLKKMQEQKENDAKNYNSTRNLSENNFISNKVDEILQNRDSPIYQYYLSRTIIGNFIIKQPANQQEKLFTSLDDFSEPNSNGVVNYEGLSTKLEEHFLKKLSPNDITVFNNNKNRMLKNAQTYDTLLPAMLRSSLNLKTHLKEMKVTTDVDNYKRAKDKYIKDLNNFIINLGSIKFKDLFTNNDGINVISDEKYEEAFKILGANNIFNYQKIYLEYKLSLAKADKEIFLKSLDSNFSKFNKSEKLSGMKIIKESDGANEILGLVEAIEALNQSIALNDFALTLAEDKQEKLFRYNRLEAKNSSKTKISEINSEIINDPSTFLSKDEFTKYNLIVNKLIVIDKNSNRSDTVNSKGPTTPSKTGRKRKSKSKAKKHNQIGYLDSLDEKFKDLDEWKQLKVALNDDEVRALNNFQLDIVPQDLVAMLGIDKYFKFAKFSSEYELAKSQQNLNRFRLSLSNDKQTRLEIIINGPKNNIINGNLFYEFLSAKEANQLLDILNLYHYYHFTIKSLEHALSLANDEAKEQFFALDDDEKLKQLKSNLTEDQILSFESALKYRKIDDSRLNNSEDDILSEVLGELASNDQLLQDALVKIDPFSEDKDDVEQKESDDNSVDTDEEDEKVKTTEQLSPKKDFEITLAMLLNFFNFQNPIEAIFKFTPFSKYMLIDTADNDKNYEILKKELDKHIKEQLNSSEYAIYIQNLKAIKANSQNCESAILEMRESKQIIIELMSSGMLGADSIIKNQQELYNRYKNKLANFNHNLGNSKILSLENLVSENNYGLWQIREDKFEEAFNILGSNDFYKYQKLYFDNLIKFAKVGADALKKVPLQEIPKDVANQLISEIENTIKTAELEFAQVRFALTLSIEKQEKFFKYTQGQKNQSLIGSAKKYFNIGTSIEKLHEFLSSDELLEFNKIIKAPEVDSKNNIEVEENDDSKNPVVIEKEQEEPKHKEEQGKKGVDNEEEDKTSEINEAELTEEQQKNLRDASNQIGGDLRKRVNEAVFGEARKEDCKENCKENVVTVFEEEPRTEKDKDLDGEGNKKLQQREKNSEVQLKAEEKEQNNIKIDENNKEGETSEMNKGNLTEEQQRNLRNASKQIGDDLREILNSAKSKKPEEKNELNEVKPNGKVEPTKKEEQDSLNAQKLNGGSGVKDSSRNNSHVKKPDWDFHILDSAQYLLTLGITVWGASRLSMILAGKYLVPSFINNGYEIAPSFITEHPYWTGFLLGLPSFCMVTPLSNRMHFFSTTLAATATAAWWAHTNKDCTPLIAIGTVTLINLASSLYYRGLKGGINHMAVAVGLTNLPMLDKNANVVIESSEAKQVETISEKAQEQQNAKVKLLRDQSTSAKFVLATAASVGISYGAINLLNNYAVPYLNNHGLDILTSENVNGYIAWGSCLTLACWATLFTTRKISENLPNNIVFGVNRYQIQQRMLAFAAFGASVASWQLADSKVPLIVGASSILVQYISMNWSQDSFVKTLSAMPTYLGFESTSKEV